jgi:hemoglobin
MNDLPIVAAVTNPHFERIGGAGGVARLVDAFYAAMEIRPEAQALREMHAADLQSTKAVLRLYLSEWLGGPRLYSPERGPPRLRRVHAPFAIDAAARTAWLACMQQALVEVGAQAELQTALMQAFGKIAEHIQNA